MLPSVKKNFSVTYPFFNTRDLDFAGLKLMHAKVISSSRPFRIHLLPRTDAVVTVRSFMKALIGGCWIPDFEKGPLHCTSADFTSMFMASAKRITEMVHLVIIPFLSSCHSKIVQH